MPRCLAMAAGPIVSRRRTTSCGSILVGRPLYLPSALALAMPSRWRSNMISRSQVATPARMVSISLLVGFAGVETFAAHGQHDQADLPLGQARLNRQQFHGRACQAVRFRHHQEIPGTQEFKAFLESAALGNAADLFRKHLLNATYCGLVPDRARNLATVVSVTWPPDDRLGSCRTMDVPASLSMTSCQRSPLLLELSPKARE